METGEATRPADAAPPHEMRARGTTLGRYLLLDRLGAGGMGVVYAAYDPELDRKVAVKLLHAGGTSDEREARLLREAQAMARLQHPNVVTVHDVGVADGVVFVAMELVEGTNLSGWRTAAPRRWREVVRVFLGAGEGLAAAHRKGLVHRDFKPDNVLVRAADGQVLVTDFGLARHTADTTTTTDGDAAPATETPLARALTRAGAIVGTPAYMAPEQHRGDAADARADQFAFCVALYEALYGERPFAGTDTPELSPSDALALAVINGQVRPAPRARDVPGWLRRVVVRGLAPGPLDRWPSMDALLAALRRDPARRARRVALAAAAIALVAGGGIALARGGGSPPEPCAGVAAPIAAVWTPAAHDQVTAAFAANGKPYAVGVAQRVATLLDRYADGWAAMRTDACAATEVRHEQSAELLDLRMACLDARLAAFGQLVDLDRGPVDDGLVTRAINAADGLPPLAGCADAVALRAVAPLPTDPGKRLQIIALTMAVARVTAYDLAGKLKEGLAADAVLLAEARTVDYAPTLADALYFREHMLAPTHDPQHAAAAREALVAAADAHQDARLGFLFGALAFAAQDAGHAAEGLPYLVAADAALRRAGNPPQPRVALLSTTGQLLQALGKAGEAEAWLRTAVAIQVAIDPRAAQAGVVLYTLGSILVDEGKYAEARVSVTRALDVWIARFGPEHPVVVTAQLMLGNVALMQRDYATAAAAYRRGAEVADATIGPQSVVSATAWLNLGIALAQLSQPAPAEAAYQRALAIRLAVSGPDHVDTALVYENLAGLYLDEGRLADAAVAATTALAIKEKALGPSHPRLATTLGTLGEARYGQHAYADAQALATRRLAIDEAALAKDHPSLAMARVDLARVDLALAHPAAVLPLVDAAQPVLDGKEPANIARAAARYLRGAAHAQLGGDRAAARAEVIAARELGATLATSPSDRRWMTEITAWLAAHP